MERHGVPAADHVLNLRRVQQLDEFAQTLCSFTERLPITSDETNNSSTRCAGVIAAYSMTSQSSG